MAQIIGGDEDNALDKIKKSSKSKTPIVDAFTKDLTKLAKDGKLDPCIGREKEIERMIQILSRRKKNNPVIVGEPGVGKTALAEGLADRIVNRKVPHILQDKRIVSLEMSSLVAGTQYRGQFEERMKELVAEVQSARNIIVFIDEIHTIVGSGTTSNNLDAANLLKPALARGEFHCIGATTLDEFREHIEKDAALDRRFQKIIVEEPSYEDCITILSNLKTKYEAYHGVSYTDEAIKACIDLSTRYMYDRQLPDKAIDILDEAGVIARMSAMNTPPIIEQLENEISAINLKKTEVVRAQKYEEAAKLREKQKELEAKLTDEIAIWEKDMQENSVEVNLALVEKVVATITGVPVESLSNFEKEKLLKLSDILSERVKGQPDAIAAITRAIKRGRLGLKDPNRPTGSFLFVGSTGVGKTELAKSLAYALFNDESAMIRVDMSEYMEKFSMSRLIGAPPGYVGHEEGGQLSEKVRRKPYSVVLFDEIEKAHPEILNVLLHILDSGEMKDGQGRKISFKNTIVILTSNLGTKELQNFKPVGLKSPNEGDKDIVMKAVKKHLPPELVNRFDDIIYFNALTEEVIHSIIGNSLNKIFARLQKMNISTQVDATLLDKIKEEGYNPTYGARHLNRAIQKIVEDPLADWLISNINYKGDIVLSWQNDELCVNK